MKKPAILSIIRRQDWDGFSLNFLSVVLGIALTFWGEAVIRHHNEQSDLKKTLELVHEELVDNLSDIDQRKEYFELEYRAALYLSQYYDGYEACDPDSLSYYCNVPLSLCTIELSSNALELLKTSSLFQKIEDKELALGIIRAYNLLNVEAGSAEYYNTKKQRLLEDATQSRLKAVFARNNYTAAEMWDAITSTDEGRQFLNEIMVSYRLSPVGQGNINYIKSVIADIEEMLK